MGAVAEQQQPRSLSTQLAERGIQSQEWHTLKNSLYPGAKDASVLLVVDYCKARKLDPMKKPCHIVPMNIKDARSGKWEWRDVVLPGIYELRTTAQRTGEYLGHSVPEYGEIIEVGGVKAPEWCSMTIYRWHADSGMKAEYPVMTFFEEAVALKDGKPNQRWSKAPRQMLTKCTEAAGLREAFPDELGGEMSAEEMDGQRSHHDTQGKRQTSLSEITAEAETVEPDEDEREPGADDDAIEGETA